MPVAGAATVDWITVASGVTGVLLGGGLTYLTTHFFERQRRYEDRLGKAYALLFAVLKIAEDLTKMELDLRSALAKVDGEGSRAWSAMTAAIGYSQPIVIPPEDLTIVALTRDASLLTQIQETEAAHRIYLESLNSLNALRMKLETFGTTTAVSGQIVSFQADEEQYMRTSPTLIQLSTLSASISSAIPQAAKKARLVAEKLGPHLKSHFKFKPFLTMAFPVDENGVPKGPQETSYLAGTIP